jgi:hypothetical protein
VVTRPAWVLDTGALIAYAAGDERVGIVLADAADLDARVAIPVLCLVEAYRELDHDEHELLGPLRANSAVVLSPVEVIAGGDSAPIIGAMARTTGRLGAAHAVYTAMAAGAAVVSSRPDQLTGILGAGWPITEV